MIRVSPETVQTLEALADGLRKIQSAWVQVWVQRGQQELEPQWRQELNASNPNRLQRAVLVSTSKVTLTRDAVLLRSGAGGRLSSGTPTVTLARSVEFGGDQNLRTRYIRRDKPVPAPAQHTVTRRTRHPIGPRVPRGNVVWPALGRFVPRSAEVVADLFVEVVRSIPGVK